MDIKQLRYFVTIAEEGQITRAAKRLHMAQPPLSLQLKLLEQELGVLLLERNGRQMELTQAGAALYEKAEQLLHHLTETVTEVQQVGKGISGVLSIGCVQSCFSHLPERIRHFREHYPLLRFQLREGDSFRLSEELHDRKIELALVRLPVDMTTFASIPLPSEPFVAVMPKEWETRFPDGSIQVQDLAKVPLLLLHRINGTGTYEVTMEEFRRHGCKPNVVCECPNASMLLSLVREGVGVTLLPTSALTRQSAQEFSILNIIDANIQSESAVIWLRDRYVSQSARRFLDTFLHVNNECT
ncbi:DNA-binding transcriptional LysR family regulator [Aneurinibacillus soli]|uniref:HTH-type transcriptional regulator BenM n=1 Tax=Aneurinibacillus soli TaxID=1500254 RepID=A0A0U5B138_9BACL|nr:LysR family transcriptional regulator [Aneurinibacillus soli]PYE64341.1 DNA-binding transcriptional LysR family regulator [Aneurinibacillus soli]BAU28290.1 HTH-type transcriptional regulator BenM [Aneurinibacillus soli]